MKRLFGIAAILCGMSALHAAPRSFTSTDGKTIEADLVGATGLQATLKLTDGRETVVPLNRLSQSDQDFVAQWLAQHPQAIRYSFVVDATKDKLESKTKGSNLSITTSTATKWLYHVKITNRASQPVAGVTMRYQIHYIDVEGTGKSTEYTFGSKDVPMLKPGESTTIDTDPVELIKTELQGGYMYANGARSRQADTIKGLAVTLEHNGSSVFEFATGGVKKVSEKAVTPNGRTVAPR
jgi:hypothetical protein